MADPGWYPDPGNGAQSRWWDGYQWTAAVQGTAPPTTPGSGGRPPPPTTPGPGGRPADLESTVRLGRQVATWLWLAAAILAVTLVASAWMMGEFFESMFNAIDELATIDSRENGTGGQSVRPFSDLEDDMTQFNIVSILLNILMLGMYGIGVLFAVWLYKAASLATRLGLRGSLKPYWALLGFVVPIVNLWFPYVVARDCLPGGHPGRRDAGAWWGLYLTATVGGSIAVFFSIASVALAMVLAVAAGGIGFMAVVKARDMIGAISGCQTDMVERAFGSVGGPSGVATWTT